MELITRSRLGTRAKLGSAFILLGIGFAAFAIACLAEGTGADQNSETDQSVREILENEIRAQKADQSLWRYQETKTDNGKVERVEVIETRQGELERLLAVNGVPLASVPEKKEEARIHSLVSERKSLQAQRRKQQDDVEQELRLLRMLANAFHYEVAGRDGKLLKVNFTPNPSFRPPTREGEVFHHMSGTLWLDTDQRRLARMSGRLTSEVNFGWGILGHLAKGGTFDVEQSEVGERIWELTRLDVNMDGKALFFKTISVKQKVTNSNFRPVSAETTLRQAAELLKPDFTTSARTMAGN